MMDPPEVLRGYITGLQTAGEITDVQELLVGFIEFPPFDFAFCGLKSLGVIFTCQDVKGKSSLLQLPSPSLISQSFQSCGGGQ